MNSCSDFLPAAGTPCCAYLEPFRQASLYFFARLDHLRTGLVDWHSCPWTMVNIVNSLLFRLQCCTLLLQRTLVHTWSESWAKLQIGYRHSWKQAPVIYYMVSHHYAWASMSPLGLKRPSWSGNITWTRLGDRRSGRHSVRQSGRSAICSVKGLKSKPGWMIRVARLRGSGIHSHNARTMLASILCIHIFDLAMWRKNMPQKSPLARQPFAWTWPRAGPAFTPYPTDNPNYLVGGVVALFPNCPWEFEP